MVLELKSSSINPTALEMYAVCCKPLNLFDGSSDVKLDQPLVLEIGVELDTFTGHCFLTTCIYKKVINSTTRLLSCHACQTYDEVFDSG